MMPRYPAYKDSGVEWLGEVPAGWDVKRLRHVVTLTTEKAATSGNPIALENIESWSGRVIPSETEYSGEGVAFHCGDILFGKLRPYLAKVAVAEKSGEAVGDFHVLRPQANTESRFLQLHLLAPAIVSVIDGSTYGSKMPRAGWDFMADLRLAIPPFPEQTAIAAFLDRETARIDGLVSEQRRLIALLREKRQAVISHAVTKGLNPIAPLKPSGIDWLGDVPEGWEVMPLKKAASVQTGIAKGKDNAGFQTVTVPYLRVANVQDGHIDLTEVSMIEIPADSLDRYRLRPGDVLMNEGGDFDKLGRGHIWDGQIDPCIHQNHVFAVRPYRVSPEWLNAVTGSDYAQFFFMSRSKQSTNLASISSTNLMELPLVLPPPGEQAFIAAFIEDQSAKLDTLTATAATAITLLQERRAALISAAVTGKIDVRALVTKEDQAA